ncbi:hypothetical protein [Marinoscillum pacificum]|uniref:hypothetical protein n=1 Tax=Marinoscillum pacificum TaxID=392723 RepID=UPI0021573DF9|nr:hypothetical protein [Marinoscillum pacificum]
MKFIFLTLGLLISSQLFSQQITYQVLEDNPDQAYSKFIAPEWGAESNTTNLSLFLGANGRIGLTEALTLEGVARIDLYQINGSGIGTLLEGGVFLPLKSKIKEKKVPVILSYNPYAGTTYKDGKRYNVEETRSITIPNGQYKNQVGVRGGLHNRLTSIYDNGAGGNIFLSGVYLGGQWTSQAYVRTKINNDVERIGAGFTRVYGDLLVLPVSTPDAAANTGDVKSDGILGWRVGYQWYVSPHNGDYKFLANSVFGAEIGHRPLSGFMFNVSWGFAFLNSK